MSFNFLSPILIDAFEEIFFMDIGSKKIYKLGVVDSKVKLQEVDQQVADSYFDQVSKEQQVEDKIPYEDIYRVLNTEKQISEQNNKHVFRRS
jgi:hypothetical protein